MTDKEIQTEEVVEKVAEEKQPKKEKEQPKVEAPKKTPCWLVSKADYIIEVKHGGQVLFIQPFGRARVLKETVEIKENDARYLTFVKI